MNKTVLLFGFLIVSTLSFGQWEQVGQEIVGDTGDSFTGTSVAMNSTGEIVAVYDSFINGTDAGRVRVFELQNSNWVQLGNDIPGLLGDGQSDGRLRMNAEGTRVILSNENHGLNGEYSGGVQVFELENNLWIQVGTTLYGNDIEDFFGSDVDISADGNTIVIGARQSVFFPPKRGFAQVFTLENGSWVQKGQTISGANNEDETGHSVSINNDGTIIAIASPGDDTVALNAGKVVVYEFLNNNWSQVGSPIFGENEEDELGLSIIGGSAIDFNGNGSNIVVASMAYSQENDFGQLRVFENEEGEWVQKGNTIFGNIENADFGQSVEMNDFGNILSVGSPFEGDTVRGAARVFKLQGSSWEQNGETLFVGNNGNAIAFGWSTAINNSGDRMIVGAPLFEVNSSFVGSAIIYQNDAILSSFETIASQFKLYPNPNNGIFDISFPETKHRVTIKIIDLLGRQVVTIDYFNTNKVEVNENLNTGIYLVEITAGGISETVRIVVE